MTAIIVGAGSATVIAARPAAPDDVAVISTSPTATPVTSPDTSTTAIAVSPDSQSNSAPATGCPLASAASAARRRVSPATTVSAAGVIATALTSCATVTVALPDAEPAVAVIVAVPFATAVTSPDALTVAPAGALLAQLTAAPEIALPFWSRTSAVNCSVAPKAVSWTVAGMTATDVGRGGSGVGGRGFRGPVPAGVGPQRRAQPDGGNNEDAMAVQTSPPPTTTGKRANERRGPATGPAMR